MVLHHFDFLHNTHSGIVNKMHWIIIISQSTCWMLEDCKYKLCVRSSEPWEHACFGEYTMCERCQYHILSNMHEHRFELVINSILKWTGECSLVHVGMLYQLVEHYVQHWLRCGRTRTKRKQRKKNSHVEGNESPPQMLQVKFRRIVFLARFFSSSLFSTLLVRLQRLIKHIDSSTTTNVLLVFSFAR